MDILNLHSKWDTVAVLQKNKTTGTLHQYYSLWTFYDDNIILEQANYAIFYPEAPYFIDLYFILT